MGLWEWLLTISASSGGPGQPFTAQWQYVTAALVAPALIGALWAGIIILAERIFGLRLGGGGI
ncbi:MAG: hypothetical protein FJ135_08920 [Deltaproteobacteria bacterium]|nr:hypothetical protein [Deltaproteobacteria bacterium]